MSEIPTLDRVWIQNWGGDEPTWQDEQIFGEFDDCPDLEFINIAAYDAQAEHIAELEADIADCDNRLLHALEGRSDEVHCGCCAPLRAEVEAFIARAAAQAERIAELEAALANYDALEDAVDQAQAWALDVHLGNREALQGKAVEIYALCYNARNEETTDELE